jgi:hypothetical protein
MDVVKQATGYLVGQHLVAAPTGVLTSACLSVSGCSGFRSSKSKANLPLALVTSFFRYAYCINLVLHIVLDGPKGLAKLFSSGSLTENPFVIHTVVFLLINYFPNDYFYTAVSHKYVAPFIQGAVLINNAACGLAAMDANAKAGFPYALILAYIVCFGAHWVRSEAITMEGMMQTGLVLVPCFFWESIKTTVFISKSDFITGLAFLQLGSVLLETFVDFSIAGKLTELYNKIPAIPTGGAAKKGKKSPATPRRSPSPKKMK